MIQLDITCTLPLLQLHTILFSKPLELLLLMDTHNLQDTRNMFWSQPESTTGHQYQNKPPEMQSRKHNKIQLDIEYMTGLQGVRNIQKGKVKE